MLEKIQSSERISFTVEALKYVRPLNVAFETDSVEAIKHVVREGAGLALRDAADPRLVHAHHAGCIRRVMLNIFCHARGLARGAHPVAHARPAPARCACPSPDRWRWSWRPPGPAASLRSRWGGGTGRRTNPRTGPQHPAADRLWALAAG